jgi:hypothetical protein
MRRKLDWKLSGFAMVVVVGVAIMTWTHIQDPDPAGIGRTLIIVGALGTVFAKLDAKTERSTEDYREGYDKGKDDGYKMAQEEGLKAKPERPVLVDCADRFERERT